jgi:hypothetical protein
MPENDRNSRRMKELHPLYSHKMERYVAYMARRTILKKILVEKMKLKKHL